MEKVKNDAFIHGYMCAVTTDIRNHGDRHETDDCIKASGLTFEDLKNAKCDKYDLNILKPIFKRLELMGV